MKSFVSGLLLVLIAHSAFTQKSPVKFGNVPLEDLKMTTYAPDSSADAVYLVDYGEAYVTFNAANAVLNFERHLRIKILKSGGLDEADIQIPLWKQGSGEEKVISLKAITYNLENGAIVESKMSKDGIFKEKFNKNVFLQKFTLPNVKVGSIIECSYTVSSEFLTNFPNWEFQHDIPVRHSEYWALLPEFFFFEKYMQGYLAPTSYEVKPQNSSDFVVNAHHWTFKNVPAFKEEPFMTCEDDYISKVNFALSHINFPGQPVREVMGSWEKLSKDLLESEDFGKAIRGTNSLKKKVDELLAGETDPTKKMEILYKYVKENIEWDGTKDKYPDNIKTALETKKGTAADINILLASMLDKAEIPVDGVLLSTRDHGFIRRSYPMEEQFNYVICRATIGDKVYLLDATDKYLPMNVLPSRCLNGEGLVISNIHYGWIKLETKAKAKTVINAELNLDNTGELKGKLSFSYDGYDAQGVRESYAKKGEKDYVKDFLGTRAWTLEKTEFQNIGEIDKPAKHLHDLVIAEHATTAGDVFYLNPFVTDQVKENFFKMEKREYPVDFGSAIEKTYMAKITLPEGVNVDELPKPKVMMLPGNAARYTYNITQTGNVITAVSLLQINKSLFVQTEYPDLREFYNQLVAKQAEQIVLRKK